MKKTPMMGSITWTALCGLAARICDVPHEIAQQPRSGVLVLMNFKSGSYYVPRSQSPEFVGVDPLPWSGFIEQNSRLFQWNSKDSGSVISARKIGPGYWYAEYIGPSDSQFHRLLAAAVEPEIANQEFHTEYFSGRPGPFLT